MAIVGQVLQKPEIGWRRYDDNNINIAYEGEWSLNSNGAYYGSSRHMCKNSSINPKIKFNFTGTRILLLSSINSAYSDKIEIKIDNDITEYFSQSGASASQVVCYVNTQLANKDHYVEITKINRGSYSYDFILDAIDIDENGELKPYNDKFFKFLIKQNNQYYTIKSEFYDELIHDFTPLTLNGGSITNTIDIDTFGFEDLLNVSAIMNKNNDIFRPLDKLSNNFVLNMYKAK